VKKKEHAEPALQEVHEWREKVFKEVENMPSAERAKYLNEKVIKARREFRERQK
jgi:hypothetical protein